MQEQTSSLPADPTRPIADIRPYRDMPLPRSLVIPRSLAVTAAGAVSTAAFAGFAARRGALPQRVLRTIFYGSTAAWAISAALDLAEHLRLEKQVTGSYLHARALPLSESLVHAGIILTNLSALVLARPLRRRMGLRDGWLLVAPAVFLAFGCADEIGYHRRRAPHREEVIHAVEHLAEGIMWTSLYATRLIRWR
jgi:hypothetical protein